MKRLIWMDIERDKYGFATDKCLDNIFNNLPVYVKQSDGTMEYIGIEDDLEDWRGDIERKTRYAYYLYTKN